jgi:DUF2075 family protein
LRRRRDRGDTRAEREAGSACGVPQPRETPALIIYRKVKREFLRDMDDRNIEEVIASAYLQQTGQYAPNAEFRAWRESLTHMAKVVRDDALPPDIGVGIEFGIPQTSKRIDFLLSGLSDIGEAKVIIVELKQWSVAKLSDKDGIIVAQRGGAHEREGTHPCYQAWSYAALLEGFNQAIEDSGVDLRPCAYLHNYRDDGVISHPNYAPYMDKAPLFLHGEAELQRLRAFIRGHLNNGDDARLIYEIENGRIRPTKMLVDGLSSMLRGNQEFVLIDDQKVVFETGIALARRSTADRKEVAIVSGGPGTGKSVVAINLLVALSKLGLVSRYVSKNAAPRKVYEAKLAGRVRAVEISSLFGGSGAFTSTPANAFDALVVDEAHRLNERSGLYGNLGENQIKEIIVSAKSAIFFVDDDQQVTLKDIGRSEEIERWAHQLGARVTRLELASQFRCGGSDGYLAWLDDVLGIRGTANDEFDAQHFDFRVIDSPVELHALIAECNAANNKSRMVAGYCWDWSSRRRADAYDIVMPEFGYARKWNLTRDGSLWIMAPDSIDEVGCIHTCQGLEVEYIGVIVGPDLLMRDGRLAVEPGNRSTQDRSIRGWRQAMRVDPIGTSLAVDRIIRNTYRTLMTRGMRGCYVYCTDPEVQEYFRRRAGVSGSGSGSRTAGTRRGDGAPPPAPLDRSPP